MDRPLPLLASLTLLVSGAAAAQAPAGGRSAAPPPLEWKSTARAPGAVSLPPATPMSADLVARTPAPRWADVPLPPPPTLRPAATPPAEPPRALPEPTTVSTVAPPSSLVAARAVAVAPRPALASAPAAAPAPLSWQAYPRQYPLPQFLGEPVTGPPAAAGVPPGPVAPLAAGGLLAAAAEGSPADGGRKPSAEGAALAASPAEGTAEGAKEPKVTVAADQTGLMLSVSQDLESDRVRTDWARSGGSIVAQEASVGGMMLYKDLSKQMAGAYLSGYGVSFGGRLTLLQLTPPKYESRDRSWNAFKLGVGGEMGLNSVKMSFPPQCYTIAGRRNCIDASSKAVMRTLTLSGTIGVMHAVGSFDSPTEWSGMAVGVEWAPSWQSTNTSDDSGNSTSSSAFNLLGVAFSFESGSLQSMAAKMGKKARIKLRVFLLPPVGDLPLMATASVGAVWY